MINTLKKQISVHLKPLLSRSEEELQAIMELPKDIKFGQVAMPVFRWSKELKKPPAQIAQDLAEELNKKNIEFIEEITPVAGFLNFRFVDSHVQKLLFSECQDKKDKIGEGSTGAGKTTVSYTHLTLPTILLV